MPSNLDWENENSHRKFPFLATTSLQSSLGYTLPNEVFVDCLIQTNTHYIHDYILSKIEYTQDSFTFYITNSTLNELAFIGHLESPFTKNQACVVLGNGVYENSSGWFIIGNLDNLLPGVHIFNAQILPTRIVRIAVGITSINGISDGNVILTTGTNVVITTIGNTIKVDTKDGICACTDNPCIKTINGISPINNNFRLESTGCVKINPITSGVEITNVCESACCGCDETNDFIDLLNSFALRLQTLENNI